MRDSSIFLKQYRDSSNNYKIVDNVGGGNKCFIYFSGNGIYDPSTVDEFSKTIVNKDRYEWTKWRANSAREIYIRDIHKLWYTYGINSYYNNVEKVLQLLEELSKGYEIVTVGSSAGGYAAVLFGSLLKAKQIFAFSAQFDLEAWLEGSNYSDSEINEVLSRGNTNLKGIIEQYRVPIYYFYPSESQKDIQQMHVVKECDNVILIGVKSKLHGKALYANTLPDVLNENDKKLQSLCKKYRNKNTHPFILALYTSGVKKV